MRILIVEDERKMAGALKKGLEAENHVVSLAFDGREGLELALSGEFDVLVLDLMPLPEALRFLWHAVNKLPERSITEKVEEASVQ